MKKLIASAVLAASLFIGSAFALTPYPSMPTPIGAWNNWYYDFLNVQGNTQGLNATTPALQIFDGKGQGTPLQLSGSIVNISPATAFQLGGAAFPGYVINNVTGVVQTPAYAATVTIDASKGSYVRVGTLTGNITLANPINPTDGEKLLIELTQDGTGSRTLTLGSAFDAGPWTMTLTTTALKSDIFECVYDGNATKWLITNFQKGF